MLLGVGQHCSRFQFPTYILAYSDVHGSQIKLLNPYFGSYEYIHALLLRFLCTLAEMIFDFGGYYNFPFQTIDSYIYTPTYGT